MGTGLVSSTPGSGAEQIHAKHVFERFIRSGGLDSIRCFDGNASFQKLDGLYRKKTKNFNGQNVKKLQY